MYSVIFLFFHHPSVLKCIEILERNEFFFFFWAGKEWFTQRLLNIFVSINLIFMPTGFVFVDELLKLRQFKRYSENEIRKVVDENDKKRFALRLDPVTNRLQIRANQGHTIEVSISAL